MIGDDVRLEWIGSRLTYANVMATLAVFLGLAGGAYALSGVPDSGGLFHGCVSNRTGLLRVVGKASSCHKAKRHGKHRDPGELAVSWNQQGPRGLQGAQGAQGAQGIHGTDGGQGIQGPPGPTAGATESKVGTPSATPNGANSSTATIATTTTSKLLISGSVAAQAICSTGSCSEDWGLYLDGQPLPGIETWTQGSGSGPVRPVSLTALTGALPAGTHSITMRDTTSNTANTFGQKPRLSVIALGG
jgi:hypothetical protein